MEKTKVFNVIILDKSGSMRSIRQATIDGVNETINGIKVSQDKFKETQQHYILLNAFCSHGIDTIYNNVAINEAKIMTEKDYKPCCCTPLYDAMGITLTALEERLTKTDDYMVSVTVVTDGYENASGKFSGRDIKKLIERLKEKGWSFTYLGADHDVEKVAGELSFDRSIQFDHTDEGTMEVYAERSVIRDTESLAMEELRVMESQSNIRFSDKERREYREKRIKEEEQKRRNPNGNVTDNGTTRNSDGNSSEEKRAGKKRFPQEIVF